MKRFGMTLYTTAVLQFFTVHHAFAQGLAQGATGAGNPLVAFLKHTGQFINKYVIVFLYAVAFLIFVWGVFRYFTLESSNEDGRAKARTLIIYSVIGFVLISAFWGILALLIDTIGITDGSSADVTPLPVHYTG